MIKAVNKKICCLPLRDAGITKEFSSSHNGTDWGWINKTDAPVYPIQDGVVREVGYEGVNSGIGYYVTIEHQYDDSTHRFSGYIHLKSAPLVKKGQEVKAGETVLGYRGGTPTKSGKPMYAPHLHLYTTAVTTKAYSWNNMKALVINPFKELTFCKLKGVTYALGKQDGHNFGVTAPIYEEKIKSDSDLIAELRLEVAELENQKTYLSQELAKALDKVAKVKEIVL